MFIFIILLKIKMKKSLLSFVALSFTMFVSYDGNAQSTAKAPLKAGKGFTIPANVTPEYYLPKTVILKLKPEFRHLGTLSAIQHQEFNKVLNFLGVDNFSRKYPRHSAPDVKMNSLGQAYADLSLIYQLQYSNNVNLEVAINQVLASGIFQYAEPHYIHKAFDFEPNDVRADSVAGNQRNAFKRIRAYKAWDLALGGSQGDTSVVIGIVDSGTDTDHPDLAANFKKNYADPIDGIDNDNDGYIDNFMGYDLAGSDYTNVVPDNDPVCSGANTNHGSHVSGCASQVSNNGTGGAGIGFNCKLLPVKCAADNDTRGGGVAYIIAGYDGIVYAADHGAQIINCSWGGPGGGSFGQDIIDYATINKNSLVVAAAGNSGLNEENYPSSYQYAISVAATNSSNDSKASFSTYDYTVDISAPGNGIDATIFNNTYTSQSGTSMASPIVAGAAGLVLSKYPSYTALQIGQRLKATTDNHYVAGPNVTSPVNTGAAVQNKLGTGRLNAFRALIDPTNVPSVVFQDRMIVDNNDNAFVVNDTLYITGKFINYLASTTNLNASIRAVANGANVTPIDTTTNLGVINTLAVDSNTADPFTFKINAGTPQNTAITFRVLLLDGTYSDKYFFTVTVNVDYINITINEVHTTITSKGKIGYNQDGQLEGLGFSYNGNNLLYEGGVMMGTSTSIVSDCVRGTTGTAADVDFASSLNVFRQVPATFSEFDVHGRFNDSPASPTQNLSVAHSAYAWSTPGNTKYVIVEYVMKNTGSSALNNLYTGIAADWDVDNFANNKSDYEANKKMGYTYCTDANGKYAGIKLLTNSAPPSFYVLDNVAGGGGGVDINDAGDFFSTSDKYTALSTQRLQGGNTAAAGNDVLNVMSAGPYSINPGDSAVVAFALIAGDDLADIQSSADSADVKYNGPQALGVTENSGSAMLHVFPNPASDRITVSYLSQQAGNYTFEILNAMGTKVLTEVFNSEKGMNVKKVELSDLAEGAYIYRLIPTDKGGKSKISVGKLIITKGGSK